MNAKRAQCHPSLPYHALGLCRRCYWNANRKRRLLEDPDFERRAHAAVRKRHPDKEARRVRGKNLWREFRMSLAEWDQMFELQGRACAICRSDKHGSRGWHTDHDHSTGLVRGILCHGCNSGIGFLRESQEILHAAGLYLAKHSPPVRLVSGT